MLTKTKEPWEMTREEFIASQEYEKHFGTELLKERREIASDRHWNIVRKALRGNKSVPPEVLKDYPEFTPKPKAEKGEAEAQARYKELMKSRLEAHDKEIKAVNDDFMAGKLTPKEMEEKHKVIHKKTDSVAATMRKRAWGEYPETLPSRAELEKVQRMRSLRSQASDLARQHSVVISPVSPKVATWLHDQSRADISGIDTPPITGRKPIRITPKRPRLKR